jgi:hypothetical protein
LLFGSPGYDHYAMTTALTINLKPILGGWSVCLSDGRELARFIGPWARWRALRYLHAYL